MTNRVSTNKPGNDSSADQPQNKGSSSRVFIFLGAAVLIGLIFTVLDLAPNLSHMDLNILSGSESGQNHTLVKQIAEDAAKRSGAVANIVTQGTADNLKRLAKANDTDDALFAIVPDGLHYPQAEKLELIARLPKSNTVFFLGRNANQIRYLADMKNMRIGIGPNGSGTALFAQQVLGGEQDLAGLNLSLSEHGFSEQINKLLNSELDLGVFVTTDNNPLLKKAVQGGLQLVSFANAEAWSTRFPALHVETLYAGHYDHVTLLPKADVKVFKLDNLVLSDRSASRSDIVALLVVLNETFHGFLDHNKNMPNHTGLEQTDELKTFVDNGGPNFLDEYVPGLVDFMPPANLLHYLVVISVLMNLMTVWNRLRLYVLDDKRIKIEDQMYTLFGTRSTLAEIHKHIGQHQLTESEKTQLDDFILRADQLHQRCRKYAPSIVTPLGQENIYRYHEGLIAQLLKTLRDLRGRTHTDSQTE